MPQDLKYTLRLWAARPWHTAFAIAALAIGIGANTGVFSMVNALLLRSLPFREPDRGGQVRLIRRGTPSYRILNQDAGLILAPNQYLALVAPAQLRAGQSPVTFGEPVADTQGMNGPIGRGGHSPGVADTKIRRELNESSESDTRYRGLLETAPDGIVVVNQAEDNVLLNNGVGPRSIRRE
jgi:PAS domain-containing protein